MKLICCHIENFGKLSNCDFDFTEGLNSICEENGWGKSTFAAFIRAMFYGLDGKRKQNVKENEYQRYTPWQGGVFGGWLTFETKGKTYKITRTFGTKEEFELRDANTNMECHDYSENIGEELFQVNRESFMRTVFIGQNDCKTGTTDDINSKIGNLTDGGNDMNCYEDADEILKKIENALTPKKSTGSIKKREGEITELRREVSLGESLQEDIGKHQGYMTSRRTALEVKKAERLKLSKEQEKAAKMGELLGKRNEWRALVESGTARKQELDAARENFPGDVPELTELDKRLDQCIVMDTAGERMEVNAITEAESVQYGIFLRGFEEGVPTLQEIKAYQEQVRTIRNKKEDLSKKEQELLTQKAIASALSKKPSPLSPLVIGGIVGLVVGAILCLVMLLLGIGVFVVGAVLCIVGLASGKKVKEVEVPDEIVLLEQQIEYLNEEIATLIQSVLHDVKRYETVLQGYVSEERLEEQLYQLQMKVKEYETLDEKRLKFQMAKEKYDSAKETIITYLEKYQLPIGSDLRKQLQVLKEQVQAFLTIERYYKEAEEKKMLFAASTDVEKLETEISEADIPNVEELNTAIARVDEEIYELQEQIRVDHKVLEELQLKFEEWEEKKTRLEVLVEQQEKEKEKYRLTGLAREYLAKAKEAITMRYAGPILERFLEYYEKIVTSDDTRFYIDANTKVTVEELGKQRETDTLSAGYQDLIHTCLRIAYVDAMYQEEKPMLILDDSFVNLDDKKVEAAKEFLHFIAEQYQVIYFTCSKSRI